MNDQIDECIECMAAYKIALGDNLKPVTLKKYKGDLKSICKLMGGISPIDSMDLLRDHEAVVNTLHTVPFSGERLYNKESLKSKIGLMSMLMESRDEIDSHKGYFATYTDIKNELTDDDRSGTSDKRVKAKDNELLPEDIDFALNKYKASEKLPEHLKYLAVSCMSKIPSRRTEYGTTKFIKSEDEIGDGNYLLMDDEGTRLKFILQEYKTAGRYGRKEIEIPDELSQDILDSYIKFPREYLFPKTGRDRVMLEEGMGSNTFVKHVGRIFKDKKVSVNSFRKYSKNHGIFDMGVDALAKEMGHSVSTSERSYAKNNIT
tara:strand:+ start:3520 stop:4473 length:954 start_codon:yes stop_codon:yes gene_type:complete